MPFGRILLDLERHAGDLPGMLDIIPDRQPAHHHVGVPYSLHLVHLVRVDNTVKTGVKIVEEVNHLQ